jgi:hypothetical protein
MYIEYSYDFTVLHSPVTGKVASFCPVPTKSELKKIEASFFQRAKSSDVPVTQPAGCGGKCYEF